MKKYHLKKFLRLEYTYLDIIDFYRGNIRYFFYNYAKWALRKHILEQINYRINIMDQECYTSGSCKMCGCNTPHLQMANKTCEGKCYPVMMNKKNWKIYVNQIDKKYVAKNRN